MKSKIKQFYNERNIFKRLFWRLQFRMKIVPADDEGRCINCDAGNSRMVKYGIECSIFYCPCDFNHHLKRKRTYKWLYKKLN